jgi:beta-galactosidase
MWGAYRGFFDNGIQADWVHIDDLDGWDAPLYAPYPISLTAENARRLADWVANGGRLISEACPGYFGDHGHVGTVQPNSGLAALFGARETEVEFMPDIGDRVALGFAGGTVGGGGFLQSYALDGGTERGRFGDGRLAVVEHAPGAGRTLLVGSHPSVGYFRTSAEAGRRYFADVLAWTGKPQQILLDNNAVQARLHRGDAGDYVWIVNPTREVQTVEVTLGSGARPAFGTVHWADAGADLTGRTVTLPARGIIVVRLEG